MTLFVIGQRGEKCWNYLKRSTDSIHLSLRNIRVSFSPVARQTRFLLVTTKQAV